MWIQVVLLTCFLAQVAPPDWDIQHPEMHPRRQDDSPRMPNGKLQKDAIATDDYEKSVKDARDLERLSQELKAGLEQNGKNVLSIDLLKKTEEIEKLAKRIHDRMKRY